MTGKLTMTLLVLLALGVSLAAANPPHPITRAQEKTTCGLEAKGYYTQGQPIVMRISLQNHSYEPSVVDLGYDREGALELKLKRGEGEWMALPHKKVRDGISRVGKFTIPSQEGYSQQIILDDWYKFSEPGKYVVSFALAKSPRCFPLELPFEILPMSAQWLSDASSELLDKIRQNKDDYAKAADAANVLARIDNPLVVPFLIKALEANPMVDSIVIPAIERVGDKQAIHFLISFLEKNVSSSSRYELVRPALVRLEKRSAAEEVEAIRIALARFPAP